MKRITHKLRHLWHDAYYAITPESGVHFAMNCKEVTAYIDLEERPKTWVAKARFWLHLSVCQVCKSYLELSQALARAVRTFAVANSVSTDVENLNQSLLKKHAKQAEGL